MKVLLFLLIAILPLISRAQTSQVKVSLRNGTTIEGKVKEFDALDHITIIVGGIETTIPMSQIAYISNLEEKSRKNESVSKSQTVKIIEEDPLKDFKGFLLAKGNKVYVESSNSDGDRKATYDKEGAMVLKALLKKDSFWTVVDKKNHAHFVIHYRVITRGKDKSQLTLNSWRTGKHKSYFVGERQSNESELKNNIVAQYLYKKLQSLQKKIEKEKVPKSLKEDFTIK